MDRISSLPDEVLCHILSFLTTKEATLTSVLSKRWRNLLAFVHNLDINDSVFLHPEEGRRDRGEIIQSFMDFVDRILALQGNSSIQKFSLKCLTAVDRVRVDGWISNVLARGVSDMDLSINFGFRYFVLEGFRYQLPSEIFVSRTLVELKIRCQFPTIFRPGHISLPMLKTLALDLVWLFLGQLQMILSACPALEKLDMANIHLSYGNETVSSPSLKTLTMKTDSFLRDLSFDAPKLVCLKYSVAVVDDYPLVNLENLVEAHIELKLIQENINEFKSANDDQLEDDAFLIRIGNVRKLVRGICNVQKLYLSPGALQVLALCCQVMPVFNNLVFLDIESNLDIAWQAMPVLLRNCPHLETLVLKGLLHRVTGKCGDSCICISREEKGRSLASCPVKRLEIRGFVGFTGELEMIKHFLDYFPCLKEMEIYITDGPTPQRSQASLVQELNPEMLMRYNQLSGRSPNVKFKVHGSLPWTAQ